MLPWTEVGLAAAKKVQELVLEAPCKLEGFMRFPAELSSAVLQIAGHDHEIPGEQRLNLLAQL